VFGSERNPKRGEKALQRIGARASGSFIVPSAGLARSIRKHLGGNNDEDSLCRPALQAGKWLAAEVLLEAKHRKIRQYLFRFFSWFPLYTPSIQSTDGAIL
jgi:hypothetical protein